MCVVVSYSLFSSLIPRSRTLSPMHLPHHTPLTTPGPPLAVMVLAGPSTDCLLNTIFFIAGVIPGHIHGFYITCTYFSRKRKVRKGRYPGGRKAGIYSEEVWNGGASNTAVRKLKERERREGEEKLGERRGGGADWLGSR